MPPQHNPSLDRLVRKETALGTLRELLPPEDHIGSTICPIKEVPTDDVIFDYAVGLSTGLTPARSEEGEAELAQKDYLSGGSGRASVIDWSEKTRYKASDVQTYREALLIAARLGENGIRLGGMIESQLEQFRTKLARDDAFRRRRLDNRLEWLALTPLDLGGLVYNDGKIQFEVDYGRPADQHNQTPSNAWDDPDGDPIGDISAMQELMYERYGIKMGPAIISRKAVNKIWASEKFKARFGAYVGGTPSAPLDLRYMVDGWSPEKALAIIEQVTGIKFKIYDSVYRQRVPGTKNTVNVRFTDQNKVYFLPDPSSYNDLEDEIGFAKMLTSPHPEGNWQPGFYEWEKSKSDPWATERGSGIKAFPIFTHMDWTYTMKVI